jgi:hypothetical protein
MWHFTNLKKTSFYDLIKITFHNKTVEQFLESLAQGGDRLFTIPDQRWIKFSTALEARGDKLKLKYKPEEMIFRS